MASHSGASEVGQEAVVRFQERVWEYYHDHARDELPWRQTVTPYGVFVSEVMLQQTQVVRVRAKYAEWLAVFPDFETLAAASGPQVLGVWQGLGYNRRGLWLREAARRVVEDYAGRLPDDPGELVKLPGIGPNTAGSIAAFAYNRPVVFIETNIRRAFIHEFFPQEDAVPDAQLRPLIEAALDHENPREWYWALMDYGAWLATQVPNPNRRSKHYARQSQFEGSARQIRGEVLRQLLSGPKSVDGLGIADERLPTVLAGLDSDGLIAQANGRWRLVD